MERKNIMIVSMLLLTGSILFYAYKKLAIQNTHNSMKDKIEDGMSRDEIMGILQKRSEKEGAALPEIIKKILSSCDVNSLSKTDEILKDHKEKGYISNEDIYKKLVRDYKISAIKKNLLNSEDMILLIKHQEHIDDELRKFFRNNFKSLLN